MPNWGHYWKQTAAGRDADGKQALWEYADPIPAPSSGGTANPLELARYELIGDHLYVSKHIVAPNKCLKRPTEAPDQRIDCFAVSIRHESQHRKELNEWWTPDRRAALSRGGINCTGVVGQVCSGVDSDGDMVPDAVEPGLGCDPKKGRSCKTLPQLGADIGDAELNAYWTGWTWVQGTADEADWACPGEQCKDRSGEGE